MVVRVVDFVNVDFQIGTQLLNVFEVGCTAAGFNLLDGGKAHPGGGGKLFLGDVLLKTYIFQPHIVEFYHKNLPKNEKKVLS